jgi:nucleoside-diphosphate-sugar epimerase
MSILITGGCGFIGVNLARRLLEKRRELVLFDIAPQDQLPEDLKDRVKYIRGDIANWVEVINAVKDYEVKDVFHFAATLSAPSEANPWRAYSINVGGTFHIMEASRLFGVDKLIFSSSMGAYGETKENIISDGTVQEPMTIYGVTKVFDELLGRYYHKRFGIHFRAVRFPQLIGPGVRSGGFGQYNPGMIQAAAFGEPYEVWVPEDTILPLLYINDAIHSLISLYEANESDIRTRVYNLGQITPSPTAKELADIVKEYVPDAKISFKPDPKAVEVLKTIPKKIDGSNAEKEWGWKIEYSAREMVNDFLEEIRLHRERYH